MTYPIVRQDAVDRYSMRQSDFLRGGHHTESVFTKPLPPARPGRSQRAASAASGGDIGQFEAHTR